MAKTMPNTTTNTTNSKMLSSDASRIKLSQEFATLINNPQGSDIQFKVGGGGSDQKSGKAIYNESAATILYGHSNIILCRSRYFAAILNKDRNWKEKFKTVIDKPNISPSTFKDVLNYIYTGSLCARNSTNVFELMVTANEMNFEELSISCQEEFMRAIECIFFGEDDDDDEGSMGSLPIDVVIRTHIIPVLNNANNSFLTPLSQQVMEIILPHMSVILQSPKADTEFVNKISSDVLVKTLSSDDLALTEFKVWNLVLDWACHQSNITRTVVEANLKKIGDVEDVDDNELTQLKRLKAILLPYLPAVRFSLFKDEEYASTMYMLDYFLPSRRSLEIEKFFIDPDCAGKLDSPRRETTDVDTSRRSLIISKLSAWKSLRKNIFMTGGIDECKYPRNLKFNLLFRASKHGFGAGNFHQNCDNKGPTLTIVKSADGHLFGGVNFSNWSSNGSYSNCAVNFIFALPDEHHRKDLAIFKIEKQTYDYSQYSSLNNSGTGPIFGQNSLHIGNNSNASACSYSQLPGTYNGSGASNTSLAGAYQFLVSDYEVFAISKE